jgi:hypothetical protein
MKHEPITRPETLADIAAWSESLEDFGRNLRDWQHTIQRGGVHSRKAFASRISDAPEKVASQFSDGAVADAMLAAYAEWLADQAGLPRPEWCKDPERSTEVPWFGSPLRGWLVAHSPASFRQRNLFTIPEPVFKPRPGRPPVPAAQKAKKAAERQRAYRQRMKVLIEKGRQVEREKEG